MSPAISKAQLDALYILSYGPAWRVTSGWAQAGYMRRIKVGVMGALIHAGFATTTHIEGRLAAVITAAGRDHIAERKSA